MWQSRNVIMKMSRTRKVQFVLTWQWRDSKVCSRIPWIMNPVGQEFFFQERWMSDTHLTGTQGRTLWAPLLQKETQMWKPSINVWGQDWREGGKVTTDNTNLKIPICNIIINNMVVNFYNVYIFLCNVKADTSPIVYHLSYWHFEKNTVFPRAFYTVINWPWS